MVIPTRVVQVVVMILTRVVEVMVIPTRVVQVVVIPTRCLGCHGDSDTFVQVVMVILTRIVQVVVVIPTRVVQVAMVIPTRVVWVVIGDSYTCSVRCHGASDTCY